MSDLVAHYLSSFVTMICLLRLIKDALLTNREGNGGDRCTEAKGLGGRVRDECRVPFRSCMIAAAGTLTDLVVV